MSKPDVPVCRVHGPATYNPDCKECAEVCREMRRVYSALVRNLGIDTQAPPVPGSVELRDSPEEKP